MNQSQLNRKKGSDNQRRSRDWLIANPDIYGILDTTRICIVRSGLGSHDFFSVPYKTEKIINTEKEIQIRPEGNENKVVDVSIGFKEKVLYAGFDIIANPYPIDTLPNIEIWVQTKTNSMPTMKYLDALRNIKCQSWVRKELHIWYSGNNLKPGIIIL